MLINYYAIQIKVLFFSIHRENKQQKERLRGKFTGNLVYEIA